MYLRGILKKALVVSDFSKTMGRGTLKQSACMPTGYILAYIDMDCQTGLAMLDKDLQFSQSVPLQTGAWDLQPGHMVMVSRADMQLSTPPL
jgi:hypothetical protein